MTEALTLRPYQEDALQEIRAHYARKEKKVLLHMATGGGKTVIFSRVLKGVSEKGNKAIMVVRGKQLVDNASQRLFREGIDHGCLQGNHWNNKPNHPIQVCSVDTLYRRKIVPPADLVVIDEAHYAVSPSFRWLMDQYKDTYTLGVTATPHVKAGLRYIADHVVYPITLLDLIEQGYLVKPKYFAPSKIDLSKVRNDSRTGDYNLKDLAEAYDEQIAIFGDVISSYKQHLDGAPSIVFAISKDHSRHMCELFKQAGYSAVHIEDSTPMKRRAEVIKGLEDGSINVVCNVGIFCVGVDIPCLRGVISVRPTQSYNLWIQQCGRGTRPFQDKNYFTVLDHANNIYKHGFIEFEKLCDLDGKEIKSRGEREPIICEECFGAFMPEVGEKKICPHCGHDHTKSIEIERKTTEDKSYVMREIQATKKELKIDKLIATVKSRGYKIGWIYYQLEKFYGKPEAQQIWSKIKNDTARQVGQSDHLSNQSTFRPLLEQRNR